jgi:PAS domain S-box-containing protein
MDLCNFCGDKNRTRDGRREEPVEMRGEASPKRSGQREIKDFCLAIQSFNEATSKLEESYGDLKSEVARLNLELEAKNAELQSNLVEKQRVQNHLSNILESLTTAVLVIDLKRCLTTMNRAAEDLMGISSIEAKGKDLSTLFLPHLSDPQILEQFDRFMERDHQEWELQWRSQDESRLQIRLIASKMMDPYGAEIGQILLLNDVTTIRRLEDQLNRTNRMAAMGELAVNVAHEVRNPLGSIELIASLLKKELEHDEERARLADHVIVSVKNIDHIISNLLTFTRSPRPDLVEIPLHHLLEETLEFVKSPLQYARISVSKDFERMEPKILGDGELLEQSFINVMLNAMQAMEGGGVMEIFTRIKNGSSSKSAPRTVPSGNGDSGRTRWVDVGFRDSGSGIPKQHLPRIFNPFFTTKERGAGLGLAIIHNIVEAHGGILHVDSIAGKGTLVTISLPLLEADEIGA